MKILHVVPTYLPATRYGGPIYSVHGLAKALAARGHDVHVYTTNADGSGESAVPVGRPVLLDGVHVTYFATEGFAGRRLSRRLYRAPALADAAERRIRDFDVAHLHSIFLWPGFAVSRIAALNRIPYIVAPRGMLVPELIARRSSFVKHAWLQLIERKTLRGAAAVHFTSHLEWQDASRAHLPLPSPFVLPNGVDLPSLPPARRRTASFLFLGRVNWKKRIDRIIDALPAVPDAELVIAGNDEEALTAVLSTRAEQAGVRSRVRFVGHVNGDEKLRLLRESAALLLPSDSENFGNVVIEAMACGLPVIISERVGLASSVTSENAGLVLRGEDELLRAMKYIVEDPVRASEMGKRGRKLVESHFTWQVIAADAEKAYVRVLESFRGAGGTSSSASAS